MNTRSYDGVKRAIDVVVAAVGLLFTAPIQIAVAILVRRKLGSPVIFRQPRPGRDEQIFELVKFRSMKEIDAAAGLVADSQRLTPFGLKLRSTSLDELPTLWNVLRGDMSLVGPRPLLVQYLERYDAVHRRRHEVRPGITGLAQVSGRNAITWEDKFALDVEYVDNRGFWLDFTILARTFIATIRRRGITADGDVTMPEYQGRIGGPAISTRGRPG